MTYDMAYGTQYFNANLYDSSARPTVAAADKYSVDFVVNNYLAARLKPRQMNLLDWFLWARAKNALWNRALTGVSPMRKTIR